MILVLPDSGFSNDLKAYNKRLINAATLCDDCQKIRKLFPVYKTTIKNDYFVWEFGRALVMTQKKK